MMLVLRVVSPQPAAAGALSARLGAAGGTIGRGEGNALSLPDPDRRISRRQVEIVLGPTGVFLIKNVGSSNAVAVAGRPLLPGDAVPIAAGDTLHVGDYVVELTVEAATASSDTTSFAPDFTGRRAPPPFAPPPSPPSSPLPPVASPYASGAGYAGGASYADPFADLLGDLVPQGGGMAGAPSPAAVAASRLPDDFDPFAVPQPAPARSPTPMAAAASPFGDLLGNSAPASIDHLFGLTTPNSGASPDPLGDFLSDVKPREAAASGAAPSIDPLALFGQPSDSRPAAVVQSPPDNTPQLNAAFTPPGKPAAPRPPAVPVRPPVVTPPPAASVTPPAERTIPPGWTPDAIAAWNALCEGAGVQLAPPANTGPQFLRVVGMIMRAAVEGTVQLMAVRQATRQELHAQVTQIQPKNNNPLKFSPDGQSALEQLLQPAVRGFLPGPAAMTDAMNDLLGHAIGTMAGTRAALEGVLGRFAPEQLEAKLSSKSVLANLVPAARKAQLWDLYLQHYGSIREEAQEDFHALFGRAFLSAYEQQLERLRREKAASAGRGGPAGASR